MLTPNRRMLLAGGLAALGTGTLRAQGFAAGEVVRLWPGRPPGWSGTPITPQIDQRSPDPARPDRAIRGVAEPMLVVRRPARPNGAAVLVIPGGGYRYIAFDDEGEATAASLNARGLTVFILLYRLPAEGWQDRTAVPLQDAQRAMRLIRTGRYGIDPARIAVLGFSAGGHLAGSLATRHAEAVYLPVDAIDRMAARPDCAGLVYPVVSMDASVTHAGSRDALLGPDASAATRDRASVDRRVTADTAPTFLIHTSDDAVVPVANSLMLHHALAAAKRPAELHVFQEGGHGFGVRLPRDNPAAAWPDLFHAFGVRQGVFPA